MIDSPFKYILTHMSDSFSCKENKKSTYKWAIMLIGKKLRLILGMHVLLRNAEHIYNPTWTLL